LGQNDFLTERLTLKGGTALNFVYLNLPRLSIDLDFNYTGALDRQTMLSEKQPILEAIQTTLQETYRIRIAPSSYIMERMYAHYTNLFGRPDRVKIEVNFLERLPLVERRYAPCVPIFPALQSVRVWTYALEELLAMKFKTLLERSYPRDLWDVYQVIQRELDVTLFQKLLVVYVCFIPGGANFLTELTTRLKQFDMQKMKDDLRQLIRRHGEIDVAEMTGQLTGFIGRLQLGEAEIEFLASFSQGRIQAESLFDAEEAKRVNQHPSLLWAVGRGGN
jgi:predicted nucleotidyltransferase component of viral defense system